MIGAEIIEIFKNELPSLVQSPIGLITGSIITAIFLRKNTSTQEFEKIKACKFAEVANDLLESGQMTYSEYYRIKNYLEIAKKADKYYKQKQKVDEFNKKFDFDWFMRFYDIVGLIENEEMQELWAKILSEEISNQMSFSLKTLDVLRNISSQDALLFEKICKSSFQVENGYSLPNNDEYLKNVKVSYNEIMRLSELGLIFNNATIHRELDLDDKLTFVCKNNELLLAIAGDKKSKIIYGEYPFTLAGNELMSVIVNSSTNENFMILAECVKNKYKVKVEVHKLVLISENEFEFEDENLIKI